MVRKQGRIRHVLRLHGGDERHLLLEKLRDVTVQCSRRVEVFHRNAMVLTDPVASIFSLGMISRNPVQVLEDDVRSSR